MDEMSAINTMGQDMEEIQQREYLPITTTESLPLLKAALRASERAKNYLFSIQKEDGHWCAEAEANTTMTAEYVFLCQILGVNLKKHHEKLIKHFFANQKADGSWGVAYNYSGDVSTTAETYLALRILGIEVDDKQMKRAEQYIHSQGGLEKIRIFTRIHFALFGLFPWDAIPIIPPEFILLPPQNPINIYRLASWARTTMIPLFIIFHHKPTFALPNGKSENNNWLDHLWLNPSQKKIPYTASLLEVVKKNKISWKSIFTVADRFLHLYEHFKPKKLREYALKKCEEWILERQEKSGEFGHFLAMSNMVLALYLNDHSLDSSPVRRGLEAIERFAIDDRGYSIQPVVSPVWDTIHSINALIDASTETKDKCLLKATRWITKRQTLVNYGDWKVYNPKGSAGGWAFDYENSWYPDIDDTVAIIIGLFKQDSNLGNNAVVRRAVEWVVSMQNKDGGWAAFDKDNDKLLLNEHPFSDMDALCDLSCPDITGRVLDALGLLKDIKYQKVCARGIEYLRRTQEPEGSWFGRWGVNYIYGTSNALCGLSRQGVSDDPMVRKALAWLKRIQNPDGGWGECLESYADKSLMGKGKSTPSQTAWALMGLLAYLPPADPAIQKGIHWLVKHQKIKGDNGFWDEKEFTGTGFPNHFYLRYHLYRHYFPLMALGRFCRAYSEQVE